MPQGAMEDVCRVVVTMSDPMNHEFSLRAPHFLRSYNRLGQGNFHSNHPGHDDLYEWHVTVTQKLPQGAFPQ